MWNQVFNELNQSAMQIALSIAHHLPGVAVMLAAVLVAVPIGLVCSRLVRMILTKVQMDEQLNSWGYSGLIAWSPGHSPTVLVSRTIFWLVVLFAFLIGLTALDASLPSRLSLMAFAYLPHLLMAVVILLVGAFIARHAADGVLVSAVNMQLNSARLISVAVKWLILLVATAMALEHLGIGGVIVPMAFGIVFGGAVLALALAAGLGSKDIVNRNWQRMEQRNSEAPVDTMRHL